MSGTPVDYKTVYSLHAQTHIYLYVYINIHVYANNNPEDFYTRVVTQQVCLTTFSCMNKIKLKVINITASLITKPSRHRCMIQTFGQSHQRLVMDVSKFSTLIKPVFKDSPEQTLEYQCDNDLKIFSLFTSHFNWTGFKGLSVFIPALMSAVCPEAINVLAAVAVGTGATGTDAASMPERCPVWGFNSRCWASGKACNEDNVVFTLLHHYMHLTNGTTHVFTL